MRKVLSFVLVLSLVLGSFGMAFAAPLSDIAGEKSEDAVNVLTQLGVVSGYPDGTYRPDNIVTRAEMAVIVVSALGLADYATGTSSFSDMGGHWSNSFVAYAASMGIIAGYPDGTFRPDRTVSYDEAATMLVAALGYTPDSLTGTWPANYVVKAQALGILKGIKAGAAGANRGDIAIMTFQTLDQQIGKTNRDGDWTPNNSGTIAIPIFDTMLDRLGAVAFDADVIDGTEASIINLKPYVGAYASVYRDGSKATDNIIAIKEVESVFLTGEYKAGDKVFKADIDYNISDELAAEAVVFFANGAKDGTTTLAAASGEVVIAVEVSGRTIKEIYSVAKWTVNKAEQVDAADLDEMTDDTPKLLGEEFALDDNDEIDLNSFALFGVDSLDDIKVDHVVYVYKNDDGISKIEVGTEVVTGTVTRVSSDNKYTIGGKVYEVSEAPNAANEPLKARAEVEAFLDYAGDIYVTKKLSGEPDNYAVLLASDAGGTLDNDRVRLYLPDGTSKIFEVDVTNTGDLDKYGSLVKYGVDKDGVIDSLQLVVDKIVDSSTGDKITDRGYYDGKGFASDAIIFTYDNDDIYTPGSGLTLKADDFGTTTLDKVKDTAGVQAIYSLNTNGLIAAMVMTGGASDDDVFGFVSDWGENDSDAKYFIELLVDGAKKAFDSKLDIAADMADDSKDKITLYKVIFNAAGEITDLEAHGLAVVTTDADTEATLNGYVIRVGSDSYTLDSDVAVYVKDGADKYKVGSRSDVRGQKAIKLYDTDSTKDGVYDIVVID